VNESIIDRAARAIQQEIVNACGTTGGSCNGTPEGLLATNATFDPKLVARAVLVAIREPSDGMVRAAQMTKFPVYRDGKNRSTVPRYQAMIDKALEE